MAGKHVLRRNRFRNELENLARLLDRSYMGNVAGFEYRLLLRTYQRVSSHGKNHLDNNKGQEE